MQLKKALLIVTITLTLIACNIKNDPVKVPEEHPSSTTKYGLTEPERKQLYIESSAAIHKIDADLKAKQEHLLTQNPDEAQLKKGYEVLNTQKRESMQYYRLAVKKKYNITEEQEKEIYLEGLDNNWPRE